MFVIAETIAITAVIICSNQTFGTKNCAAIMRIRFALSKLKRGKQCSLHRKLLLKNIVSFTPIHKDEHVAKKNSEEIISMFRWIAVLTVKRIQSRVLRKTIRVYHEFEEESKDKSFLVLNTLRIMFWEIPLGNIPEKASFSWNLSKLLVDSANCLAMHCWIE